jgi:SAM-dependent methyltransferase
MRAEDHPYREFERAGWARAAASYADSFETISRLFAKPLLDAVGARPGSKLLDVACGSGLITSAAAAAGAQAEGVDFSPEMVSAAKERFPQLAFRQADAEALPFADETFDAVAIGFGVHHFPFPVRALAEARRVLRVGGRVGFTVWASTDKHMIQKVMVDAVRAVGDPAAELPLSPAGTTNDTQTCLGLLHAAGFDPSATRAELTELRASVGSARRLIQLLTDGTVKISAVIRSLPADKSEALVAAVEQAIARYLEDGVFKIPATAVLAVGTRTM